jgi:hypothetical protein
MRRALATVVLTLAVVLVGAGAAAAKDVPTTLTVTKAPDVVNGEAIAIHVKLVDATGAPVEGALIRLFVPITFMGADKNAISGEGTTGPNGTAVIRFAPSATGMLDTSIAFWGMPGFAESETAFHVDVQQPVYTYVPEPVGLQAWWARAYLIPVPFLIVWGIYLLVITMVVRIRRAGKPLSTSTEPTS